MIKNSIPLDYAGKMAFEHMRLIMQNGLDYVPEPIRIMNYARATEAEVIADIARFLGQSVFDVIALGFDEKRPGDAGRLFNTCIELGVIGYPMKVWADRLELKYADDFFAPVANKGTNGIYDYSLQLKYLIGTA